LDLTGRVRALAWASSRANPRGRSAVSCRAPGLWRTAALRPRRPSIPIRFPCRRRSGDRRRPGPWIPPVARCGPKTARSRRVGEPGRFAWDRGLPRFPRRRVPRPVDVLAKAGM